MKSWRPAIRMARRDLRRHKVRALLTCLLVALPIFVGTIAAQVTHNDRWTRERAAQEQFHGGDAIVEITPFTAMRATKVLRGGHRHAPGAQRRDPRDVDLESLLPTGTRTAPQPSYAQAQLATGGQGHAVLADLGNPLTSSLVEVVDGRAPTAPDEVAVPDVVARELHLLTDAGAPRTDASIALANGTSVRVVGVLDPGDDPSFGEDGVYMLAPVDSVLGTVAEPVENQSRSFIIDLPAMSRSETKELAHSLAAVGVALNPRDAFVHPKAWGMRAPHEARVDLSPILVGGLCILVGLLEVVLLVGAAFSVAARRQVRDLGLLATNGGAGRDVRRILLAQGLVLGMVSSVVGAALGVVAFRAGAGTDVRLLGGDLWGHDISWISVAAIAALGSLTSVVAALLPGWRVSRLTPVEALSGRFPIKPGESRAHRPAFVLAGGGLVVLLFGGWATARAHARYHDWETASVLLAGIGMVVLVAGLIWCTPYVVRRLSALGGLLPLSGRYAFRDAGRHRFRSAAAVMALMITVAGAVLVGFAFRSAIRTEETDASMPPHTLTANIFDDEGGKLEAAQIAATTATVRDVAHPVATASSSGLQDQAGKGRSLLLRGSRTEVRVTDEASLAKLVSADRDVMAAFRAGSAVTTDADAIDDGQLEVAAYPGSRHPENRWTLPAVAVKRGGLFAESWDVTYVSEQAGARLGFVAYYGDIRVKADGPITQDMIDSLSVYGINAWSNDPERARLSTNQYAGLGVAGLLTALVIGMSVAMAAAESRDDVATLAAVGAGPWRRRAFGAMHGLFLGIVGCVLGLAVGVPAGLSFTQVDGLAGTNVPWLPTAGTVLVVLVLSWGIGGVVTPSRFRLTRRTA
jgi:putative ABC transport system permease protein